MSEVKARIVRSDGQEMTLGVGDWRIPNDGLENWANLPYSVFVSEVPSYDGAVVTSKRVSSVDRTITAVCVGKDADAIRARAIKFFNPKHSFEVHMTYRGRTRWCSGEQIGFKASEGNVYKRPTITWTILCPNPYLHSEGDFGRDIAEVKPMFGFPFTSLLPPSYGSIPGFMEGFAFSLHTFDQSIELTNDGDVPSGIRAVIRAKGPVRNPSVKLGGGYTKVLAKMNDGDVVVLDASSMPPTVTMNGENAMNLVDRRSSIFGMRAEVGNTTISYDADDGYQNMSVSVFWHKQYLGV